MSKRKRTPEPKGFRGFSVVLRIKLSVDFIENGKEIFVKMVEIL